MKHENFVNVKTYQVCEIQNQGRTVEGQAYTTVTALKMALQMLPVFYRYFLRLTSTKYSSRGLSLTADETLVVFVFFGRMCQGNALKCMLQIHDHYFVL